ncbi:MAG: hypothetical protein WDW38_004604 [Sanguina aurantia]
MMAWSAAAAVIQRQAAHSLSSIQQCSTLKLAALTADAIRHFSDIKPLPDATETPAVSSSSSAAELQADHVKTLPGLAVQLSEPSAVASAPHSPATESSPNESVQPAVAGPAAPPEPSTSPFAPTHSEPAPPPLPTAHSAPATPPAPPASTLAAAPSRPSAADNVSKPEASAAPELSSHAAPPSHDATPSAATASKASPSTLLTPADRVSALRLPEAAPARPQARTKAPAPTRVPRTDLAAASSIESIAPVKPSRTAAAAAAAAPMSASAAYAAQTSLDAASSSAAAAGTGTSGGHSSSGSSGSSSSPGVGSNTLPPPSAPVELGRAWMADSSKRAQQDAPNAAQAIAAFLYHTPAQYEAHLANPVGSEAQVMAVLHEDGVTEEHRQTILRKVMAYSGGASLALGSGGSSSSASHSSHPPPPPLLAWTSVTFTKQLQRLARLATLNPDQQLLLAPLLNTLKLLPPYQADLLSVAHSRLPVPSPAATASGDAGVAASLSSFSRDANHVLSMRQLLAVPGLELLLPAAASLSISLRALLPLLGFDAAAMAAGQVRLAALQQQLLLPSAAAATKLQQHLALTPADGDASPSPGSGLAGGASDPKGPEQAAMAEAAVAGLLPGMVLQLLGHRPSDPDMRRLTRLLGLPSGGGSGEGSSSTLDISQETLSAAVEQLAKHMRSALSPPEQLALTHDQLWRLLQAVVAFEDASSSSTPVPSSPHPSSSMTSPPGGLPSRGSTPCHALVQALFAARRLDLVEGAVAVAGSATAAELAALSVADFHLCRARVAQRDILGRGLAAALLTGNLSVEEARALPPASRSALLWRLQREGHLAAGSDALLRSFHARAQRVYDDAVREERGVMDARMLLQLELDLAQLDMVHDSELPELRPRSQPPLPLPSDADLDAAAARFPADAPAAADAAFERFLDGGMTDGEATSLFGQLLLGFGGEADEDLGPDLQVG